MQRILAVLKDYGHQLGVGVALLLIFEMGQVATYKFARGQAFPENWGEYMWVLVVLSGVNVAGMGVLRATGASYVTAKAAGKNGPPQVNVAGDANVQTQAGATAEHAVPQAGVKPKDPAVVAAIEAAAAQRAGGAPDDGAVG